MKIRFFPRGTGVFPRHFTLINDWKDGGDYDKSMGLIHKFILLTVLLAALFGKVFKDGMKVNEVFGFICLAAACLWVAGFIRFEFKEKAKTLWNPLTWLALCAIGLFSMFA
jgi:hypothetical protein